jgi:hypothetical protein
MNYHESNSLLDDFKQSPGRYEFGIKGLTAPFLSGFFGATFLGAAFLATAFLGAAFFTAFFGAAFLIAFLGAAFFTVFFVAMYNGFSCINLRINFLFFYNYLIVAKSTHG